MQSVTELIVFDYKSGKDHGYEAQMAAYALASMQQYKRTSCRVILLFGATRQAVETHWTYEDAEKYVLETLALRNDPAKKPSPCSYCSWCRHGAECSEMNQRALAVAGGRDDWKLEQYHASEITKPTEMVKALRLARFLKAWCASVEHAAKEMAVKKGETLPGYKVMQRAGQRELITSAAALNASGLTPEKFISCCNAKVTALEKLLGKTKFNEQMAAFIKRKRDQAFLVDEKGELDDGESDLSGS
jgi:hypothetical protein